MTEQGKTFDFEDQNYYLWAFMLLCIIDAVYESLYYLHGQPSGSAAGVVMLSTILLTMWADADSKEQSGRIYRPYDFGFLVLLFLWLYLPYYLWRTRGGRGLVMLAGLASFALLSYVAPLLIYRVR